MMTSSTIRASLWLCSLSLALADTTINSVALGVESYPLDAHTNLQVDQVASFRGRSLVKAYEIWGYLTPASSAADVSLLMTCYQGLGLTKCTQDETSTNDILLLESAYSPFSWTSTTSTMTGSVSGAIFCLNCCSNSRSSYELNAAYTLSCDISDETATYNSVPIDTDLVDYEFRFARHQNAVDQVVVSCLLVRVDPTVDGTVLVGYELTINVKEYQEGLNYWRGVDSCSAVGIEATVEIATSKIFAETIILVVSSAARFYSFFVPLLVGLATILALARD